MILYFSGTGTSLFAAQRLQSAFGGELVEMNPHKTRKSDEIKLSGNEKLIFVFPVYFSGLPAPVREFLKQVHFVNCQQAWGIFTCGGSVMAADRHLKSMLKRAGCPELASFKLVMPDSYIPIYKIPDEAKEKELLAIAEQKLDSIIANIKLNRSGYQSNLLNKILTDVSYHLYDLTRNTKPFTVSETCISCGKCAKNCPDEAIQMQGKKPIWIKTKCYLCFRCLNICPVEAIEYGKASIGKNRLKLTKQLFK